MNACDRTMEPTISKMNAEEKGSMMSKNRRRTVETAVAACGWGLFFIWTGIALIAHVGWGAGLLGVGIITLGGQVTRKYFALRVEIFWLIVGFFFVVAGVWELLDVRFGLMPILCIAAGSVLLVSTFLCKAGHSLLK